MVISNASKSWLPLMFLLLHVSLCLLTVKSGMIEPIASEGQEVLAFDTAFGPSRLYLQSSLLIDSPIPVTVLRYQDDVYVLGGAPLSEGEVRVIVKSDGCPEDVVDLMTAQISKSIVGNETWEQYTESLDINVSLADSSIMENSMVSYDFIDPPSSFHADWNYTSAWCYFAPDNGGPSLTCPETPSPSIPPSASPVPTKSPTSEEAGSVTTPSSQPVGSGGSDDDVIDDDDDDDSSASRLIQTILLFPAMMALSICSMLFFPSKGATDLPFLSISIIVVVLLAVTASTSAEFPESHKLDHANDRYNNNNYKNNNMMHNHDDARQLSDTCRIGVEILLDACSQSLTVTAPSVRFLDGIASNTVERCNPELPCQTLYETDLAFEKAIFSTDVGIATEDDGRKTFLIPTLDKYLDFPGYCGRPVEGRPFVDSTGDQLQAQVVEVKNNYIHSPDSNTIDQWNKNEESLSWSIGVSEYPQLKKTVSDKEQLESLLVEWTRRALGEHASIASFAAFTMALLTNQAPSDLVEDALKAAMDEVQHAKTSFEVVTLFSTILGRDSSIGPGPMPPSKHEFSSDLTSLAVATAQEGCIDETLSALMAAAEADYYAMEAEKDDEDGSYFASILNEKIRSIAIDESRHASLAWRTVHWACQKDESTRDAMQKMMITSKLDDAFKSRVKDMTIFQSNGLRSAWERVYKTLVPKLLGTLSSDGSTEQGCDDVNSISFAQDITMLEQVSFSIINQVRCSAPMRKESNLSLAA